MDSTGSSSAEITSYAAIPMADAATYTGPKLLRMCALVLQDSLADGQLTFRVTKSAAVLTVVLRVETPAFMVSTTGGLVQTSTHVTLFTGARATDLVERNIVSEDFSSFLVCAQLEKHYSALLGAAGTLTLTATYEPTGKTAILSDIAELAVSNTRPLESCMHLRVSSFP